MARRKQLKYEIGSVHDSLLIIGKQGRKFHVQCQICKEDPELYGEAKYWVLPDYLSGKKLPCGCSKSPKRTQAQWEVILNRKADSNNEIFNGFVGGFYVNQDTKIHMQCCTCGNKWDTCSVSNYTRNRSCPLCAKDIRAMGRSTSDVTWVSRFVEEGGFNPDIFSFKRLTKTSRLWNVICKVCGNEKSFVSDRSNLVAGKIPCDCNRGGGFDKSLKSFVYVIKCEFIEEGFTGFDITNFPRRRMKDHIRESWKQCHTLTDIEVFETSGENALRIESILKNTFEITPQNITGFIREATHLNNYDLVLELVKREIDST